MDASPTVPRHQSRYLVSSGGVPGESIKQVPDPTYKPVPELSRLDATCALDSGDSQRIASALYSVTRHDHDWRWVQEQLLRFIRYEDLGVRWAAATCLGDLAMFHRTLDREQVLPALEQASLDSDIREVAELSIAFVKQFVDR